MPEHTILAVDDDPGVLDLYQKILTAESSNALDILGESAQHGPESAIRCRTYTEPRKLLDEYKREVSRGMRHPLCIVDMKMVVDGIDKPDAGLETAEELRKIDPDIAIVFCTAVSHITPEEAGARLHDRVFFVGKPFNNEEFILLIKSIVGYWQSRQQLNREKAFLMQLLESVPDLVFMKDTQGVHVGCNEAFCRFLGYPREQVIGSTDHDLYPQERADLFRDSDNFVMTRKEKWSGDEWVDDPGGSRKLLRALKFPVLSGKGDCIGLVGIVKDITKGAARASDSLSGIPSS